MAIALLVSGVGNLWAQTDVTSDYITNADFSGDRSEYTLPLGNTALSSNRCIYQPEGWNISVKNKNQYNYSVVKLGDKLQTTDFNSEPYIPTDGKYMVRFRNGNNESEHITLSQTFTISVPGVYEFSADLIREDGSKIDVTFSAAGSSVSNSSAGAWQTKSFEKIITTSTEITVSLKFSNKATSGDNMKRAGADDVKIVYKKNLNGETLAALIAQATSINTRTGDLSSAISTAQGVYNDIDDTPDYQDDIDGAITTLRSAITTSLGSYSGLDGTGNDVTAFIANSGFETSPIFNGTSNGTSGSANAVATSGSTTLYNSVNAYYVPGWELKTTETSDYVRSFSMPFSNTLYVQSNGSTGGQEIASPTNGSSVTTSNDYLLLIQTSWCKNAVNAIEQTIPLPAGSYRLTFDSYVGTTLSNASSLCGISYGATPTTVYRWPSDLNTWTANVIDFELAEQTNVTFSLGYKKTADQGAGSTPFLFVDNLKLTYYTALGIAQLQWQEVHDALNALNANVLPTAAKNAINTELAKSVPTTTPEAVNEAKGDLQDLIDSYAGIKAAYEKVNDFIDDVKDVRDYSAGDKDDINEAITAAESDKENCTDVSGLNDVYTALESARQTYVTSGAEPAAGHPFDWTFKLTNPSFENSPFGWTLSKGTSNSTDFEVKTNESEAQDGEKYYNAWAQQIEFIEVYQNVTLPLGDYTLKGYLYTGSGGKKAQHIYAHNGADNSSSNLSSEGAWVQLEADFKQTSSSSVKIGVYSAGNNVNNDSKGWFRADNFQLFYNGQKPILNDVITSATPMLTANVGDGVFQIPSSAAETLSNAIDDAQQDVYDDTDAYGSTIQDAIDDLQDAIDDFKAADLNAPDGGKRYKLTLADRGTLTYQTASTEGGYGFPFMTAGDYMAQSFTLTKVSGNTYTISFEDLDGNNRYICTRAQYGEGGTGTAGIRSFVEGEDGKSALQVKIQATSTDNVFYMLNTEREDAKIGSNGGDFYTDNTYTSWSIAEASQASVTVSAKAGKYGTVIFPFTPDISSGFDDITFYSCSSVSDGKLTLATESTPAANTPYIIKNDGGSNFSETLTGWGTASAASYKPDGSLLTGVYTATTIEKNAHNYVLQTPTSGPNNGVQAFYLVSGDEEYTFTATAYKAYLTYSAGGGVKAFYLDGDETAVSSVKADELQGATIYNLAGQRVSKAQKGVYIINGKKVAVK